MPDICSICLTREAVARGHCHTCYTRQSRNGTLQRTNMRGPDLMEELKFLGFDPAKELKPQYKALAPRLGVTVAALAKAHRRHREKI